MICFDLLKYFNTYICIRLNVKMNLRRVLKIKYFVVATIIFMLTSSCATKERILYMQNLDSYTPIELSYIENTLQADDILSIKVEALNPDAALPFNKSLGGKMVQNNSLDIMRLEGYLVSKDKTINFPILGVINVEGKTITSLEEHLKDLLDSGGFLIKPSVTVRLLNAKVTILGEVRSPGTYTFTENNMSFLQAIGLAGDLTINANRKNITIIRNSDGIQMASLIDLTTAEWLNGPYSIVKPNDVIVVAPNGSKIKSSGFFGNSGSFVSIASLAISVILLITSQ